MLNKKMISILSISLITILGSTAVSPALAGIKNEFSYLSDEQIQLVLMMTPLFIIPTSLLCNQLASRIGMKKVLVVGIALYLIGGLGSGIMPSFNLILAGRALLGIGCGLVTPMAQALISEHYEGRIKEKMTGYSASASYLMGIVSSVVVGQLVLVHWRLSFLIYSVAFFTLFMNFRYLPDERDKNHLLESEVSEPSMNYPALWIMVLMGMINIAFYTYSISIALFLRSEGIGNLSSSGPLVASFMMFGFLVGLVTDYIRQYLKAMTPALACVMMGLGYYGLSVFSNLVALAIASALIGGSYSIFYSSVFIKIGKLSRTKAENTKLVTGVTASMFIGQSVSGYVLRIVELVSGIHGYRFKFGVLAMGLFFSATMIVLKVFLKKKVGDRYGISNERPKSSKGA